MDDTQQDGGPAFPSQVDVYAGKTQSAVRGMTLRDYFAAHALKAILRQLDRGIRPQDCIRAAEDAYFIADAMLKARQS